MQRIKGRKVARSNKSQILFLAKYMVAHPGFAAGDSRTPQGARSMTEEWEHLASALNKLGSTRTVEQWKICWRDQKRRARAEAEAHDRATTTTDKITVIPVLGHTTKLVLSAMGLYELPPSEINDIEEFKAKQECEDMDLTIDPSSESSMDPLSTPAIKRRKKSSEYEIPIDNDNSDQEEDHLAKVWAKKLKTLKPGQKLYAEKAINDILFEAQLQNLHFKKDL